MLNDGLLIKPFTILFSPFLNRHSVNLRLSFSAFKKKLFSRSGSPPSRCTCLPTFVSSTRLSHLCDSSTFTSCSLSAGFSATAPHPTVFSPTFSPRSLLTISYAVLRTDRAVLPLSSHSLTPSIQFSSPFPISALTSSLPHHHYYRCSREKIDCLI